MLVNCLIHHSKNCGWSSRPTMLYLSFPYNIIYMPQYNIYQVTFLFPVGNCQQYWQIEKKIEQYESINTGLLTRSLTHFLFETSLARCVCRIADFPFLDWRAVCLEEDFGKGWTSSGVGYDEMVSVLGVTITL